MYKVFCIKFPEGPFTLAGTRLVESSAPDPFPSPGQKPQQAPGDGSTVLLLPQRLSKLRPSTVAAEYSRAEKEQEVLSSAQIKGN